jgi:NTP pyrophosphatase (non-canonical NTP hydrolase)
MDKYKNVINELIKFRDERDWKQFHDSKNLAVAISIEAAELNEIFLWKNGEDAENVKVENIKEELADILSFSFLRYISIRKLFKRFGRLNGLVGSLN